jgi:PGF-CTERM protein
VVARGDKLFITGVAEGNPSPGIAIWILGKNKNLYTTESVNSDASFSHEVTQATTASLASGQYFVVVQHPMYNDVFDVFPGAGDDAGYVDGSFPTNPSRLFKIDGSGALQGSDAAEALVTAIDNPAVDDTYTKLQFLIEEPIIRIAPVTEKQVGNKFTINGTTNLAVDDEILVEVTSSSFGPTPKTQSGEFSGQTGTVKVVKGTEGFNTWSFAVDASTFKPDEYIIKASGITVDVSSNTLFNVVEFKPTTVPTTVPTTIAVNNTTVTTAPPTATATTVQPTTTTPGFGALIALIGLGAVAFLVVRKH